MNKPHMVYFEQEDIVLLTISEGPESRSVEISPNVTPELNDRGQLIGIEILRATIAESVQAKLLNTPRAESA